MNDLKARWSNQSTAVKVGVGVVAAGVALLFVLKILPALVAAMGIGALLAILFIPYWIPTIIAFMRKHPSKGAIFALNFFFGWTFVGWVICLVWALSDNSARGVTQSVVVHNVVSPSFSLSGNGGVAEHSPHTPFQVGDVLNGQRFNGVSWEPVPAPAVPPGTTGSTPTAAN